ncbi:MAG: NAD+ synthase [Actinobacteria bacterium]|nr:NAD+ synthase [Actinomycetota bacterium]
MRSDFKPEEFVRKFESWFESFFEVSHAEGTVAGISGGIDSSVVSVLLKQILGDKHLAVFIGIESSEDDKMDARLVAEKFNLNYQEIDVTDVFNLLTSKLPEGNMIARANLKPRLRMMTIYFFSNSHNKLVAGTGNKSELMVGYFTKYGDGACDFLPIGSLYKTEVRELARYLGIPERIITKPPSAGLWKDQTDEGEMGITYQELDKALYFIESRQEEKIDPAIYEKVTKMIKNSEHKRNLPVIFNY